MEVVIVAAKLLLEIFFLIDCLRVLDFSISRSIERITLISGTVCVANCVVVCFIILFLCLMLRSFVFCNLSRLEGIILALEKSHALTYLEKICPILPNGTKVVVKGQKG